MRIKSHMKPKLEEGGFPMMLSGFKVFFKKKSCFVERIRNTVKADEGDGGMTRGEKTDTRTHDVPSTSGPR